MTAKKATATATKKAPPVPAPRAVKATSEPVAREGFAYQIESNVPFPAHVTRARFRAYPFEQMKKGDSFLVPDDNFKAARQAAYLYNKDQKEKGTVKDRGQPLAIRKGPDGNYRCWRIA